MQDLDFVWIGSTILLAVLLSVAFFQPSVTNEKIKPLPTQPNRETQPRASVTSRHSDAFLKHNVQRQAALAFAQPVDHIGSVHHVPDPDFSLDRTIFKTIDGLLPRALLKAKLGHRLFWDDRRVIEVFSTLKAVPRVVTDWKLGGILEFMQTECDFSCEHADGSFMDHLEFVRDYSDLYFRAESPRILFLHSIMGVATNCFPMSAEKIPKLQNLLTPLEFLHVAAFPTILRLLKGTDFLQELYDNMQNQEKKIEGVKFTRVLDKAEMSLTVEEIWTHLNFHLIHALDFLPVAGWKSCWNDVFLHEFFLLYMVLSRCGKLRANVNLPAQVRLVAQDVVLEDDECASGLPDGLISRISRSLPKWFMKNLTKKNVVKLSQKADISLEYTFF